MARLGSLFLLGFCRGQGLGMSRRANTKRPNAVFTKKFRAAQSAIELRNRSRAARSIANGQSPKRGRNPRPCGHGRHQCEGRRMRDQAPERALMSTSGRPVCRFPSGSPLNRSQHLRPGKRKFLACEGPPAGGWRAPEKLDAQMIANARLGFLQFLTSLLHFRSGWRANRALQRTRPSRSGYNPRVPRAGSLSLGH